MEQLKKLTPFKTQIALAICVFTYTELVFQDQESLAVVDSDPLYFTSQSEELLGVTHSYDSRQLSQIVFDHLPKAYKKDAVAITQTLVVEAFSNNMDPFLLAAVIMTESSFNPLAKGYHGEIGLMQIRPETAEWIAKKSKLSGEIDLTNPHTNIKIGSIYLTELREKFDRIGNRYLAAYNMGARNVTRLVASNIEPKIYPDKVLANYSRIFQILESKSATKNSQKFAQL